MLLVCVSDSRTLLVGRTNDRYYHHQVLGSFPTYPLELNGLDLSGFMDWALWYVHLKHHSKYVNLTLAARWVPLLVL